MLTGLQGGCATATTNATTNGVDTGAMMTALQEQAGLKLEAARGPVDFLVIDHIEKPTEISSHVTIHNVW